MSEMSEIEKGRLEAFRLEAEEEERIAKGGAPVEMEDPEAEKEEEKKPETEEEPPENPE